MLNSIGLVGLAVMGRNLAKNFASKNISVSVFNRTLEKTSELLAENNSNIYGYQEIGEFVQSLEIPRKIILMVKAGSPVDETINQLLPFLVEGDIILDCGNSNYKDTEKRQIELEKVGIHFLGCGVSGGEEGALHGPSIMPGGKAESVNTVLPYLNQIAAKDFGGGKCVSNVGLGSSGHFVKMVHNGIEYAIMQLIAEIYDLFRKNEWSHGQILEGLKHINQGLNSGFLLEITEKVLRAKDEEGFLVDKLAFKAGAKGTGTWTVEAGLEYGVAVNMIAGAVFARSLSNYPRMILKSENNQYQDPLNWDLDILKEAFTGLSTLAYLQGLDLIANYNQEKQAGININEVIRIWQGGCIIRSQLLEKLPQIWSDFETKKVLDINFTAILELQRLVNMTVIPALVINNAVDYVYSLIATSLPTNLTQAQRDFFGAHTYQRTDKEGVFTGGWE